VLVNRVHRMSSTRKLMYLSKVKCYAHRTEYTCYAYTVLLRTLESLLLAPLLAARITTNGYFSSLKLIHFEIHDGHSVL